MKFKAKETSKNKITNEIWIIKDKVYDLKEDVFYNEDYIFKSESCDHHHVPKKDLQKWFEEVAEVKKPRICEILGVEVGEIFTIEFSKGDLTEGYFFGENGYIYNSYKQELNRYIVDLLNGKFRIVKALQYTEEEKEIFKALKVLGFGWIARDRDGLIYAFSLKPDKGCASWLDVINSKSCDLKRESFSFVQWEDKEPFEIPNIQ